MKCKLEHKMFWKLFANSAFSLLGYRATNENAELEENKIILELFLTERICEKLSEYV